VKGKEEAALVRVHRRQRRFYVCPSLLSSFSIIEQVWELLKHVALDDLSRLGHTNVHAHGGDDTAATKKFFSQCPCCLRPQVRIRAPPASPRVACQHAAVVVVLTTTSRQRGCRNVFVGKKQRDPRQEAVAAAEVCDSRGVRKRLACDKRHRPTLEEFFPRHHSCLASHPTHLVKEGVGRKCGEVAIPKLAVRTPACRRGGGVTKKVVEY
jgi:hypothetical protein